jgi:uncharacterized protein
MPRVASLHRYPVKSMLGETLPQLEVDSRGVSGDRWWSVRTPEGKMGSGKNSNRFAAVHGLLDLRAFERDGVVMVRLPDGLDVAVDSPAATEALTRHLGRPVTVAQETDVTHYDDGPVSLLGLTSVAALSAHVGVPVDPARFRANILLETERPYEEDEWVGREVTVGTAVLRVTMTSPRCVMINMATADLPAQPGNLASLGKLHDACLGVIATVVRPGTVAIGDACRADRD